MKHMTRLWAAAGAAVAITGTITPAVTHAGGPVAQAARTLNVDDSATLRLVRRDGNRIYESGRATGTLPGRVSAYFDVSVSKVTGQMTIYPDSGGSLTVVVVGTPQSADVVARFTGIVAVRSGTGRYSRALGRGTFDGTVNRRTWAARARARVKLTY